MTVRRWRALFLARALILSMGPALALAACAGTPPEPVTGSSVPPPDISQPAEPAAPAVAALPRPSEPLPSAPPEDVRRLVGLSGDTLRDWMGESVFTRRDGVAEIWRFAADTCFLDVFLYRYNEGLRVAHLDARTRVTGQRITLQACYGRIMAGRPKPAS